MALNRPSGLVSRLAALLFSGLFALVFGAVGLGFGALPLSRTLLAAWEVKAWQPVPAQVLSSALEVRADNDGNTYRARVRYRYSVNGKTYESTRIGLDAREMADNLGNWQHDWGRRLHQAEAPGQTVTAWVDPEDPSRALLDPHIRWPALIFQLPFALVFTAVGLLAAWMFVKTLRGVPVTASMVADSRSSASRGQWALWFFAFFWCGISFPLGALFWMGGSPWGVKLFVSVFVVAGMGLLWLAIRQSRTAWRHAQNVVRWQPSPPRAGEPVQVSLRLSARALVRQSPVGARRLRLAQYRIDDSGSGSVEHLVEDFVQVASVTPAADGGELWQARFELPPDAPTHGGRRSGDRVDWRLEILSEGGQVEVAYDVPVQALPSWSLTGAAAVDRFDRRATWAREEPVPDTSSGDLGHSVEGAAWMSAGRPVLPDGVTAVETPEAVEWRFVQKGWRWLGVVLLLTAGFAGGLWWRDVSASGGGAGWATGSWWLACLLLLAGLHAVSRRRSLRLCDDAMQVNVRSWLVTRTRWLDLKALGFLFHKLHFTMTSSKGTLTEYRALHARESERGTAWRLTPGMAGTAAEQLAHALRRARRERSGRFVAGARRSDRREGWRPGWGWWLWLLLVAGLWTGPRLALPW